MAAVRPAFHQSAVGEPGDQAGDVLRRHAEDAGQLGAGQARPRVEAAETAGAATGLRVRPHRTADDPAAVQLAFVHDDVAGAFERAVAAGAVAEVPLVEKPWGQTLGYLPDNNGFLVELSSPAAW